jgi:hypothetical protein
VTRLGSSLRTLGIRLGWLLLAAIIAIGIAGIVAAGNRLPGTDGRPELTWAADRAATTQLDASTTALAALSADVDKLGEMGRLALTAVTDRDLERLDTAISDGTTFLATVALDTAAYRDALGKVPGIGPTDVLTLSPGVRDRYDQLVSTVQLADGLAGQWRRFTRGAADATRLVELLDRQDAEAVAATRDGAAARYASALAHLDKADAAIDEAKTLRDRLRNAADVQTLDRWLERNETWDDALRVLYEGLDASGGTVTDEVREAFAKERAAFARLPADTKPLIIIMNDVAQGGLNQAVIAIEEARGSLEEALTPLEPEGGDDASGEPIPTPPD